MTTYTPLHWHHGNPHTEPVPVSWDFHKISITPFEKMVKRLDSQFSNKQDYIASLASMAAEKLGIIPGYSFDPIPEYTYRDEPDRQIIAFHIDRGRQPKKGQEAQAMEWENSMGVLLRC